MQVLFVSCRRRHTTSDGDWSSDVCSSDLVQTPGHSTSHDVTLTWSASDSGSGVDRFEVAVDGGGWTRLGTEPQIGRASCRGRGAGSGVGGNEHAIRVGRGVLRQRPSAVYY